MFTLHSSVIDFKFYSPSTANSSAKKSKRALLAMASDDEDERDSMTYVENGILVEYKKSNSDDTGKSAQNHKGDSKHDQKEKNKWQAHNMTEYLFFNEKG